MSSMSRGRKPPSQQSLRNPANRIKKGGKKLKMKKHMSEPKPIEGKKLMRHEMKKKYLPKPNPVKTYTV